ncbi:hypothetical protein ACHAQH_005529 [Verticillium albo-atrum]
MAQVPDQVVKDIKEVQANVRKFAEAQKESIKEFEVEISPGVVLGHKNNPIDSVGAYVLASHDQEAAGTDLFLRYIPGGRYPLLASAHMTILTAKVAGVRNVVACTPPAAGKIPLATVAAMHLAGADKIYVLGGIQAVAAMVVGTETIPKVDFIAGPGNAFMAEAKRQLFGQIGNDLFAGPTEVLIVADETADPWTVATDLLSQAEHGPDTPAVLRPGQADNEVLRRAIANIEDCGGGQRLMEDFREALKKMRHYGALLLGPMTCVSYGDKCIGTNHVLPIKHAARYTGGLWVGKYLRTVTYQEVTSAEASGKLGQLCGRAARAEFFEGHARSGDVRAHLNLNEKSGWIKP